MRGRTLGLLAIIGVLALAHIAAADSLKPATRMTEDLAALHDQHLAASAARVPLDLTDSILPVTADFVTLDATAADDPSVLATDLSALRALDVAVASATGAGPGPVTKASTMNSVHAVVVVAAFAP